MPVLGFKWKDLNAGAARQSAGMAWIVVNVSLRNVTIRAFWRRLAAEAGTLCARHAHGARRHARHSLDRSAHELAHLLP
jgi:hypothetical protein